MSRTACHILSVFIGGTKTLVDSRGEWQSSIARERVDGPAQLETRGFVGDQATQPYHGSPRSPCENQARFVGRADWVKLTVQELRTGMYARVLEPGIMQAGDQVILVSQPNPGLTIRDLNDCWYHNLNPELAERLIAAEGLMEWWKDRLRAKAAHPL